MPNVLVRDVPEEVHAELQRRAQAAGQSLQQYLLSELARLSSSHSLDEILARIETRTGGKVGLDTAVEDLTRERDER